MLERITHVLKNRKQDDKGFSLVELAVVIVVIGILVAIAVPVFIGIQGSAKQANIDAAAANGSAIVAGELAADPTTTKAAIDLKLDVLIEGEVGDVVVAIGPNAPTGASTTVLGLDNFCVTASGITGTTTTNATKGPAC